MPPLPDESLVSRRSVTVASTGLYANQTHTANGGSYGWMTTTDACGYSTFFGCSNDGTGEVCGGCDFNAAFIACAAAG